MNFFGAGFIFLIAVLMAFPAAILMKKIYAGEKNFMDFMLPFERFIYKICRIDPVSEMDWKKYLSVLLLIQICWFVFGFVILLIQAQYGMDPCLQYRH